MKPKKNVEYPDSIFVKKNNRFIWSPVLIYSLLIFSLSSQSYTLNLDYFPHLDKLVHLTEFALLSWLIARAIYLSFDFKGRVKIALLAIILTVLYSSSDEWHQFFVPGRDANFWDLFADALGAFLGQWLYLR